MKLPRSTCTLARKIVSSTLAVQRFGCALNPELTCFLCCLTRHGRRHDKNPSNVNYRANIWALKQEGCDCIVATSACGSLQKEIHPGDVVLVDQFIDRWWVNPVNASSLAIRLCTHSRLLKGLVVFFDSLLCAADWTLHNHLLTTFCRLIEYECVWWYLYFVCMHVCVCLQYVCICKIREFILLLLNHFGSDWILETDYRVFVDLSHCW